MLDKNTGRKQWSGRNLSLSGNRRERERQVLMTPQFQPG